MFGDRFRAQIRAYYAGFSVCQEEAEPPYVFAFGVTDDELEQLLEERACLCTW